MVSLMARNQAGYVCMHAGGRPQEMQKDPTYKDVVEEIGDFLRSRLEALTAAGVERERILLDVGIGFGKTAEHNRALLEAEWSNLERPLFWGLSRKSFLETTKAEKKMKNRDEALDSWNRELLARRQPMVWRVHDPRRVIAGAGLG